MVFSATFFCTKWPYSLKFVHFVVLIPIGALYNGCCSVFMKKEMICRYVMECVLFSNDCDVDIILIY